MKLEFYPEEKLKKEILEIVGIKFQIEEELENLPTLYKFDLVDFNQVSRDFKKIAKEEVEYVK